MLKYRALLRDPVMDRVSECKAIFEIGKTIDAAAAAVTRTSPLSIYLRYPVIILTFVCFRTPNPVKSSASLFKNLNKQLISDWMIRRCQAQKRNS